MQHTIFAELAEDWLKVAEHYRKLALSPSTNPVERARLLWKARDAEDRANDCVREFN